MHAKISRISVSCFHAFTLGSKDAVQLTELGLMSPPTQTLVE